VWARYSSAQRDQGSGRHACNNPSNRILESELYQKMEATRTWYIEHKDFLDMVAPSFSGVEDSEDMAAILARTHIIVLTDNGVYYRVASTERRKVQCIPWPRPGMKEKTSWPQSTSPSARPAKQILKITVSQMGNTLIPSGRRNCFTNFFKVNTFQRQSLSVIVASLVRT
jgi:hypothetical protein